MNNRRSGIDLDGVAILRESYNRMMEARHTYESLVSPLPYKENLDKVWSIYSEYMQSKGVDEEGMRTVYNRQKFLLVALAMFSPQALVGGKMLSGLRPRIARMFGIRSETPISRNAAGAVFNYAQYPDFRVDCDYMLNKALDAVNARNNKNISLNICIC